MMERDYQAEVDAHRDFINKMAQKRFWQSVVAEEAALAVIDALTADNWAILKRYRGDASFSCFIKATALVELENFAGKKFGRRHSPLWVTRLGGMWEKLYIALCREGATADEATKFVRAKMAGVSGAEAETAAQQLLLRIFSWDVTTEEMPLEGGQGLAMAVPSSPDGEADEALTTALQLALGGERQTVDHLQSVLRAMRFSVSSEERLFLKMCYQDRLPVARAGHLLGMGRLRAAARMRRLLARLRQEFVRAGLYREMMLLLQDGR
jgi:hypothetical protein